MPGRGRKYLIGSRHCSRALFLAKFTLSRYDLDLYSLGTVNLDTVHPFGLMCTVFIVLEMYGFS
jgi:hypothetical protein